MYRRFFSRSWWLLALLLLGMVEPAEASHFRYGHVTWRQISGNTAAFTVTLAYRRGFFSGSGMDGGPVVGDIIFGDQLFFGDGTESDFEYRVKSVDFVNDFIIVRMIDPATGAEEVTHTYPAPTGKGPWNAEINSGARISTSNNNADGSYRILTYVDLTNNTSSAVSSSPVIRTGPQTGFSFTVPAADANANVLRFRLATAEEAGDQAFTQPPGATINPLTGVYTVPANLDLGLWSTQVIIEEYNVLLQKVGQVAVDFLIRIVPASGNNPPVFNRPPTPADGTTFQVAVGQTLTFTVQASDPDNSVPSSRPVVLGGASPEPVTLNTTGIPQGATLNPPLPAEGNPVSTTFTWTPTINDVGAYSITFTAEDQSGGFAQTSVNIIVILGSNAGRVCGGGPVGKPTQLQCCVDVRGTPASGGGPISSGVKTKGKGVKPNGGGGSGPTLKGRVKIRHNGLRKTLDARNITLLLFSGNRATIEGTGELDGEDGHTFRIVVENRPGAKDAVVQVLVDGVAWPAGELKQGKFHVKPQ